MCKSNEAVALTTAPKNHRQAQSYRNVQLASSENLRCEIGELLFCLEFSVGPELRQLGCELFERLLRRYVCLKCASKCLSEPSKLTNSGQGGSG